MKINVDIADQLNAFEEQHPDWTKLVQFRLIDGQWTGLMLSQDDHSAPITPGDIGRLYKWMRSVHKTYIQRIRVKARLEKHE